MTGQVFLGTNRDLFGKDWLLAVVKRSYTYDVRGRTRLADESAPIVLNPTFEFDIHGYPRWLVDDTDVLAPKPNTDIVITGSAFAVTAAPSWTAAVELGNSARALRVWGERRIELRGREPIFSEPAPVDRVELSWELAYGGYDAEAHRDLTAPPGPLDFIDEACTTRKEGIFAYPRNRVGRSYFIEAGRRRAQDTLLPQLEDEGNLLIPEQLFLPKVRDWIGAPLPGNFGWVIASWYPRLFRYLGAALAHNPKSGPPRESLFDDGKDLGEPPAQGSALPRAVQGASPGLACGRLSGNEIALLTGLDRETEKVPLVLPGESPKLRIRPPGISHEFNPHSVLQTVRINTEHRTLSMTWSGAVRILAPMPEEQVRESFFQVQW